MIHLMRMLPENMVRNSGSMHGKDLLLLIISGKSTGKQDPMRSTRVIQINFMKIHFIRLEKCIEKGSKGLHKVLTEIASEFMAIKVDKSVQKTCGGNYW